MTSTIKSMMFGAFLAAQVEGRDLPRTSLQEGFNKVDPKSLHLKAALADGGDDPARRQLIVRPAEPAPPKRLPKPKSGKGRPERLVDMVLHNTPRVPNDFMVLVLEKVFCESAGDARFKVCFPQIHEGPYDKESAKGMTRAVKALAKELGKPNPQITYQELRIPR